MQVNICQIPGIVHARLLFAFILLTQFQLQAQKPAAYANQNDQNSKAAIPQNEASDTAGRPPIDAQFLFHYYSQDGDHSAVTGGEGTQELNDWAGKIVLNIPIDSQSQVDANVNVNRYSSASTDKIDFRVSSASSVDTHFEFDIGYSKKVNSKTSVNFGGGGALESDYYSGFFHGGFNMNSRDENHFLSVQANLFLDTWLLIFPYELRDTFHGNITTDKRRSFSLALQYDRVLNKRMRGSVAFEPVYQKGLLSTPFHRVYFDNQTRAEVEYLPSERIKLPVAVRLNSFVGSRMIIRSFYRFYWDNFGITAHTASLEIPLKASPAISIAPVYRFHTQTASEYFAPFGMHQVTDHYYTSDYDLSGFHSHQAGIGIRWSPIWGLRLKSTRDNQQVLSPFRSVALRYVYYRRSDGLTAHAVSSLFGFSF